MIIVENNGEVYSNKYLLPLLKKNKHKGFYSPSENSDEDYDDYSAEKEERYILTPDKLRKL